MPRAVHGMPVCTDQPGCTSHQTTCSLARRTEKECLGPVSSGYYLRVASATAVITLQIGIGSIGTDTGASSYTTFISSFKSSIAALLSVTTDQARVNSVGDVGGTAVEVSFTIVGDIASGDAISSVHISGAFASAGVLIADHSTTTTIAAGDVATTLDATECTRIAGAVNATYTCDSAINSRIDACDSGHYKVAGATADACPACTPVPRAHALATYTCTSATDSRVSHCRVAHQRFEGGPGEMDTCLGVISS